MIIAAVFYHLIYNPPLQNLSDQVLIIRVGVIERIRFFYFWINRKIVLQIMPDLMPNDSSQVPFVDRTEILLKCF